jgi:hypothetical protein
MGDLRATLPDDSAQADAHFRTLADAVTRSGGRATGGSNWPGDSAEERRGNLTWAVTALEQLAAQARDERGGPSPRVLTALAVGWSQLQGREVQARAQLEALARDDLITSPEGYASLARLRQAQDPGGAAQARSRCRLMLARERADLCGPASAQAESTAPRNAS